ncbi:MAG: tetratricopeptide repeat protein [Myxococcaceae bacterium]
MSGDGHQRTRFVGRAAELSALASQLATARWVTVVGPGGGGKTRLVRQLGENLFCDLSEARTAPEATAALARGLGVSAESGEELAAWLKARGGAVLVLDNCEQLLPEARASLAGWVQGAGELRVVATSREPLSVTGEKVFELGPLSAVDAAALFVERGQAWDQRVASDAARDTVKALIAKLDRLPLAVELLAARLDVLSAPELLSRLEQRREASGPAPAGAPARHQTLSALLAWSDESLDVAERAFLLAASVYRGGFGLELASRIAGGESAALRLLGSLRRKSLIVVSDGAGATRYQPYEVVRAFYEGQLDATGRERAERAHAEALIAFARERVLLLDRPQEQPAIEALATEQENLLAIDDRFHHREPPLAAEALLALHPVLLARGPVDLHLSRLDRLLESLAGDDPEFVSLLIARADVRRLKGRHDGALEDIEGVLARREVRAEARVASEALRRWAMIEGARGRPMEALQRIRRALTLARSVEDRLLEAKALGSLGAAQQSLGRLPRAISAHSRALALLRRFGAPRLVGMETSYLAVATHRLGHVADAESLHRQALALHRELGHRRFEAVELTHLGYLAHELGSLEESRKSYRSGHEIFRQIGDVFLQGVSLTFLGRAELEARSGEALTVLEQALAIHRASNHARLEATTLVLLGHLRRDAGDYAGAAELYTRSLERSQAVEVGFETLVEGWLGEVRRAMGEERPELFEAAQLRAGRHGNPAYGMAARVLAGEEVSAAELRALAARSSEVRRTIALTQVQLPAAAGARLDVAADGAWFRRDDGEPAMLGRRRALRLMMQELTRARLDRPGDALTWEVLLSIGWPGERPVNDSGLKRVYTAVWTLRKLGLEGVLQTRGEGYLLDPGAQVRVSEV